LSAAVVVVVVIDVSNAGEASPETDETCSPKSAFAIEIDIGSIRENLGGDSDADADADPDFDPDADFDPDPDFDFDFDFDKLDRAALQLDASATMSARQGSLRRFLSTFIPADLS